MRILTLMLLTLVMIMLPTVSLLPEPPQKDVPAQMEAARGALQNARKELASAGGEWGGHRITAINHIDAALKEIGEGEKWAREHHDIK